MTPTQFAAWLKDQSATRCILVEVNVKTGGLETTRYLSTTGYVTKSTDTPANTYYSPVVCGGVKFTQDLSLDGKVSMGFGDIELSNLDGSLDSWLNDYWNNRRIKVYVGDASWVRSEFQLIFDGTVTGIATRKRDTINIQLSDKLQRLNTPLSELRLGGTSSNADKLIPLTFGECHNVEPLLVDASNLEYQVHPGAIEQIIEVRDNGVPVAYSATLATGKFRLVNSPVGQITCSVQGAQGNINLVIQSQRFDSSAWTKDNSSVTLDALAAPDGTLTADKLLDTATTAVHRVTQTLTFSVGTAYTMSVYAKAAERSALYVKAPDARFGASSHASFDLATGVATVGGGGSAVMIAAGDGWYHCVYSLPCTSSGTGDVEYMMASSATASFANTTYLGDGGGMFLWGAQVEVGYLAGPYAATTTTPVAAYPQTITEIVKMIATQWGNPLTRFTHADLDKSALGRFGLVNPQPVGLYLRDRSNVLDAINKLAQSVGAAAVMGTTGLMSLVKLDVAGLTEPVTFTGTPTFFKKDWEGNNRLSATSRTNQVPNSAAADVWAKSNVTSITNAATAPDGTMTADKIVVNGTTGNHYAESLTAVPADNTRGSGSVFVKQADAACPRVIFQVLYKNGSASTLEFRFQDERVTAIGAGTGNVSYLLAGTVKYAVDKLANGWYRLRTEDSSLGLGGTTPRIRVFASCDPGVGDAYWTKTFVTGQRAVGGQTSPLAGWNADSIIEDGTTNDHYVSVSLALAAGRTYRARVYVKALGAGSARFLSLLFISGTAFPTTHQTIVVDPTTGAITGGTSAGPTNYMSNVTCTDAGGGWWLVQADLKAQGTGSSSWQLRLSNSGTISAPTYAGDGVSGMLLAAPYMYDLNPSNSDYGVFSASAGASFVGDNASGVFVWGGQIEFATAVGKYIPTTASTATAGADYTLSGNIVNFLTTPAKNDTMSWSGTYSTATIPSGVATNERFATGDGANASFIVRHTGQATGTAVTSASISDRSIEVAQMCPVKAGIKLGYCKNWTVQNNLATGLVTQSASMFAEEWLSITQVDTEAQASYNLFTEPVLDESLLLTSPDAYAESYRRLALWKTQRKVIKYKGYAELLLEQLGSPQTITHPRFGLAGGVTGQIISMATDWINQRVEIGVLV